MKLSFKSSVVLKQPWKLVRSIFAPNRHNRNLWVIAQAADIPKASRVLDAGAGAAPYRSLFAHCDYRTQDFGKTPALAGQYANLDYECDINSIPVPDAFFDVVLCTEVLEHVPRPIDVLQEFARILRPGGKLLITAPLGSFLHFEPHHYYGGYTPHWYSKFLTEKGFGIDVLIPNGGFFLWFAQEGLRMSLLISPFRTFRNPVWCIMLLPLWLTTLPLFWGVFPLLAKPLDRLGLICSATVGYHVVAIKR
jgi:SAM-dependent methyltransferase